MKSVAIAATSLALALAAALSPEVSAIERLEVTNAAGVCQGALPNFETNLRKRPSGIVNVSTTTNAFVSCSTTQNFFPPEGAGNAEALGIVLTNPTAAPVTVACTMVAGLNYAGFMSPMQFPKSFEIPAGDAFEATWDSDDNGGDPLPGSLNVSCNLPAGVEISSVYWYNPEDGTAAIEVAPPAP